MEPNDYMQAGYDGRESEKPMWSSTCWFAFEAGKWCRQNGITPHEFKMSRGYSVIVNRTLKITFGKDLDRRDITRVG